MSKPTTVYRVFAPVEGDAISDLKTWYFRTYDEAYDFANDGFGDDSGVISPEGLPYEVCEVRVNFAVRFTVRGTHGLWT